MKCEVAQEKIALAVYGELPDEASPELDRHLSGCETCRHEQEAVVALQKAMYLYPVIDPSANLLARTRLKLEDALDSLPPRNLIVRLVENFLAGAGRLRTAPVAASVLLALGVAAGGFGGYRLSAKVPQAGIQNTQAEKPELSPQIANVSRIVREPNSETVEVTYNRLVPATMRGSLDDPAIRQLLMAGTQTDDSNDIRSNSVGLLAGECRAGHQCTGGPIREALMISARYDRSTAVRRQALAGLEPYIAEDVRVRDAVLEVLMNDDDAAVRTQALNVLRPVDSDSSVRQVLHTVASEDRNPYLRTASQQVLSQLPEIQ